MTSSLVGSEMCIRDSYYPRDEDFSPRTSWFSRESVDSVSGPEEWTTAVSYTHLTLPTICSV
eukprot:2394224-Prorocentrum_lima.AAC.1